MKQFEFILHVGSQDWNQLRVLHNIKVKLYKVPEVIQLEKLESNDFISKPSFQNTRR